MRRREQKRENKKKKRKMKKWNKKRRSKSKSKSKSRRRSRRERGAGQRDMFPKFSCLVCSSPRRRRCNTAYECATGFCFEPRCVRLVRLQKERGGKRGERFLDRCPTTNFFIQPACNNKQRLDCLYNQ